MAFQGAQGIDVEGELTGILFTLNWIESREFGVHVLSHLETTIPHILYDHTLYSVSGEVDNLVLDGGVGNILRICLCMCTCWDRKTVKN